MNKINKREFVRHFSKYLKQEGTYCLTNKGKIEYQVRIMRVSDIKADKIIETSEKLFKTNNPKGRTNYSNDACDDLTKEDYGEAMKVWDEHGCGCKKNGKVLCKEHGRV